jgi:L-xylulokinase
MEEGRCLIGVDAGTSVVKAVAFDHLGNELASHESSMSLRCPEPLWIEQDMDELWETAAGVRRALAQASQERTPKWRATANSPGNFAGPA